MVQPMSLSNCGEAQLSGPKMLDRVSIRGTKAASCAGVRELYSECLDSNIR